MKKKTFGILINIQCLRYCLTFYPSLPWPSVKVLHADSVNRLQQGFHLRVYQSIRIHVVSLVLPNFLSTNGLVVLEVGS